MIRPRDADNGPRGTSDAEDDGYRELFDRHPVAMVVSAAATGRIVAANEAAMRLYGYGPAEIVGLEVGRLVAPGFLEDRRAASARVTAPTAPPGATRHVHRDGSILEVEAQVHPIRWHGHPAHVTTTLDVGARRRDEQQLRQGQTMEAIGRLAGGIAHDFNNLLTAIGGYTRLLVESFESDDPRRDDAEQVRLAAERAAALTGQLLAFSRGGTGHATRVDVHAVIRDVEPLLRGTLGADVLVETTLRAPSAWIVADRAQIEVLLVNLAVNARDAMPRGGTFRIETDALDPETARREGLEAIPHVEIVVSDTGEGVAPDERDRIFEPFFQPSGGARGAGGQLGLATVYATVRQAGGRIRLEDRPAPGVVFRIVLPVAGDAARAAGEPAAPTPTGRAGRVLVVDDESAIRELSSRVLQAAGHDVVVVADGDAALRAATAPDARFDLVVSDVVMPGLSGVALARELRSRRPDVRVLLVSGYTEEASDAVGAGFDLLPKPFTAEELVARVAQALEAPAG